MVHELKQFAAGLMDGHEHCGTTFRDVSAGLHYDEGIVTVQSGRDFV